MILKETLPLIILQLNAPLGIPKHCRTLNEAQYLLGKLCLPLYYKKNEKEKNEYFYHYFDVLLALSKTALFLYGGK